MIVTKQAMMDERARRFSLMEELMAENQLDALLFSGMAMSAEQLQIKYVTQYTLTSRRAFVFMERQKTPKLILPTIGQKFTAGLHSWLPPEDIFSSDDIVRFVAELIEAFPEVPRIGVVSFDMLPAKTHTLLTQTKAEFVDISQEYIEKRAPKSELEIGFVKEASNLAIGSFEDLIRRIEPGINELELMGGAQGYMFSHGAKETLLLSCSEKPHTFIARPFDRILGKDDVFVYSAEVSGKNGYWSQLVRPVFMSPAAHPDAFDIWNIAKEAEAAGVKAFRPGNRLCDIAEAVEDVLKIHGCSMGVWCGHGMGCDLGDGIDLGKPNKMKIAPNMVLTIHPSIQGATDGLLYGNTYLSTQGDAVSLTGKYEESPYYNHLRSAIL